MNMRPHQFYTFYVGIIIIGYIINNTVEADKLDTDPANKLWYVVKFYRNEHGAEYGYKLRQGDTIKLGRVRFKVTELNRGSYHTKHDDLVNYQQYMSAEQNKAKIGKSSIVPQMNNYVKQSNNIKTGRSLTMNKRNKSQTLPNKGNQFFNSKNSLENTDADNLDGLKFLKNNDSIVSSKNSKEQITCRI